MLQRATASAPCPSHLYSGRPHLYGSRDLLCSRRRTLCTTGGAQCTGDVHAPGPVVIIGGGAMGSSSAHWIAKRLVGAGHSNVPVTIVERDPTYAKAASALAVGGLRYQFSNPLNVAQSIFSREVLADSEAQLGLQIPFVEAGYLFLATTEGGAEVLHQNHTVQADLGAPVSLFDSDELAQRFPWLHVDDVVLGSLGVGCDDGKNCGEGFLDPYLLTTALNKSARRLGVEQVVGSVTQVVTENTGAGGQRVTGVVVEDAEGGTKALQATTVINCAGPWAGAVAATHGLDLPVVPRRRWVYQVACDDPRYAPSDEHPKCPLVVDPAGVYIRGDGSSASRTFLCGLSPGADDDDPDEPPLHVDYDWFEERIWPVLAERAPCFEALKVVSAWAGYYDYNSFDQNAFMGRVAGHDGLVLACGHSGHGIQQAIATGRAVSELVLDGDYTTLNLEPFSYDRYSKGEKMLERNIV